MSTDLVSSEAMVCAGRGRFALFDETFGLIRGS